MTSAPPPGDTGPTPPGPPRAFTQGVGTVFQFAGVLLFLAAMFVCCGSGLYYKAAAERRDLMGVGWRLPSQSAQDPPVYSAQQAITLSVTCGVFFGLALAGIGLGLQAQNRAAPRGAVLVTAVGVVFWLVQFVFVVQILHSIVLALLAFVLLAIFAGLFALAAGAAREMRRTPPPPGHELLPADYKVPYSHMHQDPPEVRLARELDQRRQRLAVQQKELEMLEDRLKRKLHAKGAAGDNDAPDTPAAND
jgi:hypothetical protein